MSSEPDDSTDGLLRRTVSFFVRKRQDQGADDQQIRIELLEHVSDAMRQERDSWCSNSGDEWIEPMDDRAYHGIVGRFVELVAPHTEADPAAVLVQLLAAIGSAAGRNVHVRVEDDRHYPNLYVLVVGRTARGRKGTSWRRVDEFMRLVDPNWSAECLVHGGLSSGEGLIWDVRDGDEDRDIAGIVDKRRLVIESEFAAVLKVMTREGNTLSPVLRNAWDTGSMSIKTKNAPCRVTGAHIALIAHITVDEHRRRLDDTEVMGGTINRFLHVLVRRSKLLPEGGRPSQSAIEALALEVRRVLEFAAEPRELRLDAGARALWLQAYPLLTVERTGIFGAATARAEAQVLRLALTYAIVDRSPEVRVEHLTAALALWDHGDRSALYIYRDKQGDRATDAILALLHERGEWVAKSVLVDHLRRHTFGAELQRRLEALERAGLVDSREESTKGRPRQMYRARKARKASVLDLCSLCSPSRRLSPTTILARATPT